MRRFLLWLALGVPREKHRATLDALAGAKRELTAARVRVRVAIRLRNTMDVLKDTIELLGDPE